MPNFEEYAGGWKVHPGPDNQKHILRKTSLFGTYPRSKKIDTEDNPDDTNGQSYVVPSNHPHKDEKAFEYVPDILNDLKLSDHYPILQETKPGNILSFNLMKQCKYVQNPDNPSKSHYNNAFNIEETDEEYKTRLKSLAQLVTQIIKENKPVALAFQEAPATSSESTHYKQGFYDAFYGEIQKQMPNIKIAQDYDSDKQELVTLYDENQITFKQADQAKQKQDGRDQQGRPKRTQEVTFESNKLNDRNNTFTLANIHGKFDEPNQIVNYIEWQRGNNNNYAIMGDFNLLASQQARQNAKNNNKPNATIDKHKTQAERLQNLNPLCNISPVQGTIGEHSTATETHPANTGESKGGVDTGDFAIVSQNLNTTNSNLKHFNDITAPDNDRLQIIKDRQANEQTLTQPVKNDLAQFRQSGQLNSASNATNQQRKPPNTGNTSINTTQSSHVTAPHLDWPYMVDSLKEQLNPTDKTTSALTQVKVHYKSHEDTTTTQEAIFTKGKEGQLNAKQYSEDNVTHVELNYQDDQSSNHTLHFYPAKSPDNPSKNEQPVFKITQSNSFQYDQALTLISQNYDQQETKTEDREVDLSRLGNKNPSGVSLQQFISAINNSGSKSTDTDSDKDLNWQEYAYLKAVSLGLKPLGVEHIQDDIKKAANQVDRDTQNDSSPNP